MRSSIIGYSPTTTTTTLNVPFIACRAAPAIAATATVTIQRVCPLHLLTFHVALNSAQSLLTCIFTEVTIADFTACPINIQH